MITVVSPFKKCSVRLSLISYRCDMTSSTGFVIPLGVIADIALEGNSMRGLGLVGRTQITELENSHVGNIFKSIISKPYEILKIEFNRVWKLRDYDAFAELPALHNTSLTFSEIKCSNSRVPHNLLSHPVENKLALKEWAMDKLIACRNEAFWDLLDEHWADGPLKRLEDHKLAA
jgi:hypothetical protein